MSKSFVTPTYVPDAYSFTGLCFTELPLAARQYLSESLRITFPNNAPSSLLLAAHEALRQRLLRALVPSSEALVSIKLEALNSRRESSISVSRSIDEITKVNADRLRKVLCEILPERETILSSFVLQFDALIWLELEGQNPPQFVDAQQAHRDERLQRVLSDVDLALVRLDQKRRLSRTLDSLGAGLNGQIPMAPSRTAPARQKLNHGSERRRLAPSVINSNWRAC